MLYSIKWLVEKGIKNDGQGVAVDEPEIRQPRKFRGEKCVNFKL
jgi:hypothetical protein